MSEPFFCIPSANPLQCGATFARWKQMGYRCAVLANGPAFDVPILNCDFRIDRETYPGWGASFNLLASALMEVTDADIFITGGDDTIPDQVHSASQIGTQCVERFNGTFFVMQPVADQWPPRIWSEICGSPWVGRDFALRWNGGKGAFHEGYFHNWADTELCAVTKMHGILWQRTDLEHRHFHYTRENRPCPDYMRAAYGRHFVDESLFHRRKSAGFPGHLPLKSRSCDKATKTYGAIGSQS